MLEMAQNRLAIAFAKEAAAEYGMPAATFDPCGKINAAATERGTEAQRELRPPRSSGSASRSAGSTPPRCARSPAATTTSAASTRPGAVLIQPADYIRALAAGLAPRIDLYENSPVVELVPAGRRLDGAHAAGLGDGAEGDPRRQRPRAGVRPLPRPADARLHLRLDDRALRGKAGPRPLGAPARRPDGGDGAQDHRAGRRADRDPHPLHLRPEHAGLGEAGRRDRRAAATLVRRPLPRPRGPALRAQLGRPRSA